MILTHIKISSNQINTKFVYRKKESAILKLNRNEIRKDYSAGMDSL